MNDRNCRATIFSIERFSIHDGPGVRTSVFFKGCNLACIWCHNPESNKRTPELKFIEMDCIACRYCEQVCGYGVHEFSSSHDPNHMIDRSRCVHCGKCAAICPANALVMLGYDADIDSIMAEIRRDKIYYGEDGGVTVSGGEPLLQADFCRELLTQCKKEGISTCIETAGDVSWEQLQKVLPVTDLFLFDHKISDAKLLYKYTKGRLSRILQNLHLLRMNSKEVILRCPIIPGINDTDLHLKNIAKLAESEQIEQVELMPYHSYGKDKWTQIGLEYSLSELETVAKEQVNRWNETLVKYRRALEKPN